MKSVIRWKKDGNQPNEAPVKVDAKKEPVRVTIKVKKTD